jgi:hypothetical protein
MLRGLMLRGDSAGLHLVARLPHQAVDQIIRDAGRDGVLLDSLERHFAGQATVSGLVIGYGGARLSEIKRGCALIRKLMPPGVETPALDVNSGGPWPFRGDAHGGQRHRELPQPVMDP